MSSILLDLRVSARALWARPGFAIVSVLTLALGIGATTAIFSVVYAVLLRPLPFRDSERIAMVWQTARDNPAPSVGGTVSHLNFLDWQQQAHSFEALALYSRTTIVVSGAGDAEAIPGGVVTPQFFKVFGAEPFIGRGFTEDEDRPTGPQAVVISYAYWRERLGGRPDVLRQTIEVGGRPVPIVGVAPAGFDFPRGARLWRPVRNDDAQCGRDCVYLDGVARLAAGVSVAAARQEMDALGRRLEAQYPAANTNTAIGLSSLQDAIVGDVRLPLLVLLAAVGMVLLIACANVANLLLVRGAARHGEMAVRAALGAGRGRLLRFLLSESLLLSLAGACAGLLLARWAVSVLARIAPAEIPRISEVSLDVTTYGFALGVATLTTFVFGLAPAAQAIRAPLASLLGTRGEIASRRTRWTRGALVAAEVGLSLMLVFGAGLLLRSLMRLQTVDPGFNPQGVTIFTVALPPSRYPLPADVARTFDDLGERLRSIPGVVAVGCIDGLPLGPSENVQNFFRPDRPVPPAGQQPSVLYRVVDPKYFDALQIPILRGRSFNPADRDGAMPVAIVSREMAERYWPGEDPLGHELQLAGVRRSIVGIAAGVRSQQLTKAPQPEAYVPHAQSSGRLLTMVVRGSTTSGDVLAAARAIVRQVDPRLPLIRPGSYADEVSRAFATPRFYLVLLALFAILAITLAAVGVYGVMAYAVSQRTREIGVRVALGASRVDVLRLIVWQGLRPALVGITAGLAGGLAVRRLFAGLLYGISPVDPGTLAASAVAVAVLVCIACVVPARRALGVPPASALRME